MKQKRPGISKWNRMLALFMAVFVTVQLAVPAYAVPETEPTEPETVAAELQAEPSAAPEQTETPAEEETPALESVTVPEKAVTEEAQEKAAAPAKAGDPIEIPGYTRVTNANLEVGKYYLIVSCDSKGQYYALYPDESGKNLSSGDAISTAGTLVGDLKVENQTVTAEWEKDHTALDMNKLHFILEKNGNQYAFKSRANESIYLTLQDKMLGTAPVYMTVSAAAGKYTIKNDGAGRQLDFNKNGENQFAKFQTNFWGPRDSRFPIYLYTKNGETAPVIVTGELRNAIRNAQNMLESVDDAGRAAIQAEIDAATKLLADGKATQEQIDAALAKLNEAVRNAQPNPDKIAAGAPKPGTTQGQPFAPGTGESQNFRIPALITLKHQKNEKLNGRVLAAIDARWNHMGDACALDTIVSYSDNNGDNWNYNYANFFNDSTNAYAPNATAFIDPELVEGKDGTIYMMVDLFPGGVAINTAPRRPKEATGYQEVNGQKRLVLYTAVGQNKENWAYYVGDFKDGYAPVYARDGKSGEAAFYVDDHYYLYNASKGKMYCQQIGSNKMVQQNVFFYNAQLHVLDATYLWVIKSTDGGQTWHSPMILNGQVRPEQGTSKFYGVGPGAGLCTQDGTIMLTAYTHSNEQCSFIYSTDNGTTWHRSETVQNAGNWSSESCLVEIDDHTVRQFYRDGYNTLRYTDHTKGEDGLWHAGKAVDTGVKKTAGNQLSAIRYSGTLYGKPMIMVSTAVADGRTRQNGHVYTFVLENDNSLTLVNSHRVTPGSYSYSSLTELKDGSIGLLYEGQTIQYTVIPKNNVVPEEKYTHVDQNLTCGESVLLPGNAKEAIVNSNPDAVEAKMEQVPVHSAHVSNGAQGRPGTDSNFNGEVTALSSALYRFVKTEAGYQITTTAADGTQVWLSTGNIGYPSSTAMVSMNLEDAGNGEFYLKSGTSYLYFYRDGDKKATFDRYDRQHAACKFQLYRPAVEGEQTPDIKGYVQVKNLNEIKDNGFYLVMAKIGDDIYVVNPSTSDNKYAQSLKLDTKAGVVSGDVVHHELKLKLTGKTAGTADVQVGATVYHVTVTHKPAEGWSHDEHGHWHDCSCGEKVDQAEHTYGDWKELKAPTETETGLKSHTCTVCGYEEVVEIAVVPGTPTTPTTPDQPSTPTNPTKPAQPGHGVTPQTGDNSQVFLWSITAVICTLCIAALVVSRKKKHAN